MNISVVIARLLDTTRNLRAPRARTEAELVVIFSRDGEKDEATIVADGEKAAKVAVLMIAGRRTLHAGDQLLVQRYDSAEP